MNEMARDIQVVQREQVVPSGVQRHGLVIGIERYRDERLNLRCARADAQSMYDLMVDPDCGLFAPGNVRLLLDGDATRDNVWRAFSQLRRSAGGGDTVWVYYAGHAAPEDAGVYWVLHDSEVDDLYGTGLARDQILRVLDDIRAERLLVFLDCCHAAATAAQKNPTRAVLQTEDLFGAYQGQGRITISSCKADEKSVELGDLGHGAFTYYLKKGLCGEADHDHDGVVTADELWDYLRRQVSDAAQRVGNRQSPMLWGHMTHDLALTLNPIAHQRKGQLAAAVERLVGLGPERLSTDEGDYCIELLRRGGKTEAERVVVGELEHLAAGGARIAPFKLLLRNLLQTSVRGPSPETLPGSDLTSHPREAEDGCRAEFESIQTALASLVEQDRFADALAELPRCRDVTAGLASDSIRQEAAAWLDAMADQLRASLQAQQEADEALFQRAVQLSDGGEVEQVIELLERHPAVERHERIGPLLDAARRCHNERVATETRCRAEFVAVKERVESLGRRGNYDDALDELDRFREPAAKLDSAIVRGEAEAWVASASRQMQLSRGIQREQAETLYQEALRLLDDCSLEQVVRLLDNHPATARDIRLEKLRDEARGRLEKIEMIRRDLQAAVDRQQYDGLWSQIRELERLAPLAVPEQKLAAQLDNWERLDPQLREAVLRRRGEPVLRFQPGDENFDRLRKRLERAVEVDRLWNNVHDSDEDHTVLEALKRILWLQPTHQEALRRIKPLYGNRGWKVCGFAGHTQTIVSVGFSADGRRIFSRDAGGAAKIWSLETETEVTPVRKQTFQGLQMCVSPHGDYALSGFGSNTIRVWDAQTGEEISWLEGHRGPVYSLAFSPDGRLAMSASRDQTIRVWRMDTCREVSSFGDGGFTAAQAGFSADGNHIVASGPGQVRIWRIDPAATIFQFNHRGEGTFSVFLSPDARKLCWLEPQGRVALLDIGGAVQVKYLGDQQRTFCFSADGKFVATGDSENRVRLWDTATCQVAKELLGHRYCVNCVAVSPDGTRLASASEDETVRLWDLERGQTIRTFLGHRSSVWRKLSAKYGDVTVVAFSPNGRYVASGSRDTTVQVWYAGL